MDIRSSPPGLQDEVQRLHHMNQLILDSVDQAIYGVDLRGNVIFWNAAAEKLTGYSMDDFKDKRIHDLIHHTNMNGERVPLQHCPIHHALAGGHRLTVSRDIFWRKDGTCFPVEYSVNPMIEKGEHIGCVLTFRDMTEKDKTNELLMGWEKMTSVGQLVSGIAHEIKNPLTVLKGFLRLIAHSATVNEQYIKIMDGEFDRIEGIVQELLTFAKPESTQYENKDVRKIVEQTVMLMEPQALEKSIRLISSNDAGPLIVRCVESQIKQVLINLIKNAIEAMDNKGTIVVRTFLRDHMAAIQVTDQGAGIPDHQLQRIGEAFYTTKENGTGLGLMVTNNIVRSNHNGYMEVRSQVGIGTSFTVFLPVAGTN
jgi:PAS domain S-box